MKRSRFSEEQIIAILKQQESGISVAAPCRKHGVSAVSKPPVPVQPEMSGT